MKTKTIIAVVLILIAISWFIHFLNNKTDDALLSMKEDPALFVEKKVPLKYRRIFNDTTNLKLLGSTMGKFRSPISNLEYGGKYFIEVYQIDSICNQPLTKLIETKLTSTNRSNNIIYNVPEDDWPYVTQYKSGKADKPNKIYFTLYGNQTQLIASSDSMLSYYSDFNNYSVTYGKNLPQDIFCIADEDNEDKRLPIEVLFLKKKNDLYMMEIAPKKGYTLKPGTLISILAH